MGWAAALRLVPSWVWIAIGVALAIMAGVYAIDRNGYHRGAAAVKVQWDAERVQMQAELAKEKERQAQVITRTVIEYRDRIQIVKEHADAIVKEVPILIPAGGIQLSGAFRVLHDAAAGGELPENPGRAAAAADPVEIAAAASTIFANYAACRADQARLTALQQLVTSFQPPGVSP